ncbi:MAG: DUF2806 domain-containing protein [Pyrinomonadaceae bacterium]
MNDKLVGDLAGLSQPLTKLIDAISSGIGNLYEPTHIRRKAKADADAQLILTEAEIKAEELKRRRDERVEFRELRRQENIENIIARTVKELPENVDEKPVDEDWVFQFFELCQDVSNDEMQSLWSKLLAGEVTRPGSYSLRTLNLIKMMKREDAALFTKFCNYIWGDDGHKGGIVYFVTDAIDDLIEAKGVSFLSMLHLQAIGLVEMNNVYTTLYKDNPTNIFYFGKEYLVKPIKKGSAQIKSRVLTDIGQELAPICGAQADEEYLQALKKSLLSEGVSLEACNGW